MTTKKKKKNDLAIKIIENLFTRESKCNKTELNKVRERV